MPRAVNGDYTLPGLNPVVAGTTITDDWGNNTMDDIATALTGSLSRSGDGSMLAPLKLVDGTNGAPALTWANQSTAGWYRAGASDFRFAVGGVDLIKITGSVVSVWDGAALRAVGYRLLPSRDLAASGSLAATDSGSSVRYTGPGTETVTVENLPALATALIINAGSAAISIAENLSGTMIWLAGAGTLANVGTRTLAVGGVATVYMIDANNAYIWGNGLT